VFTRKKGITVKEPTPNLKVLTNSNSVILFLTYFHNNQGIKLFNNTIGLKNLTKLAPLSLAIIIFDFIIELTSSTFVKSTFAEFNFSILFS
jgi:hypothetical protein